MGLANSSHDSTRRADFRASVAHGLWLLVEKLLRWCIHPRLRARALALLGAKVGRNVRIYEIQLFNLERGFSNLSTADDVHIGPGCRFDLAGTLHIGPRSTLSPGVTILTHDDAGSSHGSAMCEKYKPRIGAVVIGADCWLGANVTVLAGTTLGDRVLVGAGSVVVSDVPSSSMVAGVPANLKKHLEFDDRLTTS